MKTFLFLITKGCSHVKGLLNAWAVYEACVSIWHLGDINTCLNVTLSLDRTPWDWGGDSAALCLPCLSPMKTQWKTLHSGPCLPHLKQKSNLCLGKGGTMHSLHKANCFLTLLGCWKLQGMQEQMLYLLGRTTSPRKGLPASRFLLSELVPNGVSFPTCQPNSSPHSL